MAKTYKAVKISSGSGGWGGPLVIEPTDQRNKVVSVTGGGTHPVARRIAELTSAEAVDGFKAPPIESEMAVVVVDCGGTARCGVYPRKRIPTVNLVPVGQSGPLAQFITEDIYVSGVKVENIEYTDANDVSASAPAGEAHKSSSQTAQAEAAARAASDQSNDGGLVGFISSVGRVMGNIVGVFFNAGRRTIDQVIRNDVDRVYFIYQYRDILAQPLGPLANNIVGLLILSGICSLPFLSPILGPGAVIAQVIGVAIIGPKIANGTIAPAMALPALFAYNAQVGCDFVPVGLALGEAKPKTIEIGVPAVLISRQVMAPVSVLFAWLVSLAFCKISKY